MATPWDRRTSAEQHRVRDLVLASWLPQATSFADHWAELANHVGLVPGKATDLDALGRIPASRELDIPPGSSLVMRPSERQVKALADATTVRSVAGAIRRDGDRGRRTALLTEYKPIHVHADGRAGQLAIASTRSDLDRLHRVGARAARVLGLDDRDYLVNALPPRLDRAWWATYHLALGSSLLAIHARPDGGGLGEAPVAFSQVPATAVIVDVADAAALAHHLLEAGTPPASVRIVIVVGPPPLPDVRATIEDAWRAAGALSDVRVRALWGPPGARALWAECAEGTTGLHTYPDLEVLEVLDPLSGRPAADDGDLAVTSLGWHGTVLLRFRTGVWVDALATEACPACGRTTPRVVGELVPDAWQPELGGGPVDLRGVGSVLAAAGLAAWRVELRPPADGIGHDRFVVELGGDLSDERAATVHRDVTAASGRAPDAIEIQPDPELVRHAAERLGSVFADLR